MKGLVQPEGYEWMECEHCGKETGTLLDELILSIDPEFDFTEMDPDGEIHHDIEQVLNKYFGADWKKLMVK